MPMQKDTTAVFLHGLGQGPESWDKVLDSLKLPGRVLCPSLAALAGDGAADYEGLYRGLREALGKEEGPLFLCGLSLGAVLALQYALEEPQKVEGLVLIAGQARAPKGALRLQDFLFRLMPRRAFRGMGMEKQDACRLMRSMMGLDFSKRLHEAACPALVLCGERDKPNRKAAEELARGLPHSRLAFIPGAGHEVNVQAPGELADALEDFRVQ